MKPQYALGLAAAALIGLAGCASGVGTPDEFRVMRKAPLTVPPDYNLRPPAPGAARPQELEPDAQARIAVFGGDFGKDASEGEKLLVKQAGGDAVDRTIRTEIDYDSAQIIRKPRSFSDQILNFGKKPPGDPQVNAAAEADRIKSEQAAAADLTGDKAIIIKRQSAGKLPGL